jgi:hypothetical protein
MSNAEHICRTCEEWEKIKLECGDGPWQKEPSRVEWKHAGLPCIAHRGGGGAWCGYVAVPPGHKYHGKDCGEIDDAIDVHGGLTFAAKCHGHICHVPEPGEPDDVWWFGFDCAHAYDMRPESKMFETPRWSQLEEHYWTLEEVQEETNRLAEQLASIETN